MPDTDTAQLHHMQHIVATYQRQRATLPPGCDAWLILTDVIQWSLTQMVCLALMTGHDAPLIREDDDA